MKERQFELGVNAFVFITCSTFKKLTFLLNLIIKFMPLLHYCAVIVASFVLQIHNFQPPPSSILYKLRGEWRVIIYASLFPQLRWKYHVKQLYFLILFICCGLLNDSLGSSNKIGSNGRMRFEQGTSRMRSWLLPTRPQYSFFPELTPRNNINKYDKIYKSLK
jgi:hypothetical protein